MKAARKTSPRPRATSLPTRPGRLRRPQTGELADLRTRLREANAALQAVRRGEVDAVVVSGTAGPQVFTLEGAEHAYRVLIESMNEGAVTLNAEKTIVYANHCFARMVNLPLQQVIGGSLRRFLSSDDQAALRAGLKRMPGSGAKLLCHLRTADGSRLPVQISLRLLSEGERGRATTGLVVTDLTEARRSEELLRSLTHRIVKVQESERSRVAGELHDNITQFLCAVVFRSQSLVERIPAQDRSLKWEAERLRDMLGTLAAEVERISRDLRPGILHHLDLAAVLRATLTEFASRTGIVVKLICTPLPTRLHADAELALYRILQHALTNVTSHAGSRHVTVSLTRRASLVRLRVRDDGVGFDPGRRFPEADRSHGVGLLEMRERAVALGGTLRITSSPGAGTEIDVHIPIQTAGATSIAQESDAAGS